MTARTGNISAAVLQRPDLDIYRATHNIACVTGDRWINVDAREFLSRRGTISRGPHAMRKIKALPWPLCARCGLLALKNEATRKALREICVIEE